MANVVDSRRACYDAGMSNKEQPRGWLSRQLKARTGPIAWAGYALVRIIFALMQMFPIEWNLYTARLFARFWRRVMPRHYDRAVDHLRLAYGSSLSEDEIRRIAMRCLESTAMFAVEGICLPSRINAATWSKYIRTSNFEEGLDVMLEGRGALMVTGHYGSFELMGHLAACLGFEMVSVMRPLDNVYLNRYLVESRRVNGQVLLDKKGAVQHAEGYLQRGSLLGFIGDQDAGRKGVFVDFFGIPASTYKSIGLLAMQARLPIIVSYARRRGDHARYDVGIQRVIHPHEWDAQDDPLRWITQEYTAAIEAFVRVEPEQYLWIHRRWKHKPRQRKQPVEPADKATVSHQTG